MNGQGERHIPFESSIPVSSNSASSLSFEKLNELYLIRIGGVERYKIPEAVVFGGYFQSRF